MSKTKIFITGSCGFIGTHLRERLESEGYIVVGMDDLSHPCKFCKPPEIEGTILNIWKYSKYIRPCKWIIHLAAQINVEKSIIDPKGTLYINTLGTLEVLETARKLRKQVIMAGTTEIYGDRLTKKMNELHPTNPKSPYAASKLGATGLCKAYFHTYNLPVIIVTNFNTYGEKQSDDKFGAVIAKFADRIRCNKPPIIFGSGEQRRDFMYYTDAIDFYMLCLNGKAKFGEEYNVGYGKSISINELANKMIKIFGKKLKPIHTKPRPGEVFDFVCDHTKARSIGWKPKISIDTGLKLYKEWRTQDIGFLGIFPRIC